MFWKKKSKDAEVPRKPDLFREAFLPQKKAPIRKRSSRSPVSWRISGVMSLWTLFVAAVVYIVFASSFHSVRVISVVGMDNIPESRLEASLRDRISGSYFSLFPKDNFFLVSSDDMERFLLESFPKLRSAEVRKRFPDRMEVVVSERDRISLWCFSETCFLLNDDGRAEDARFALQSENEPFLFRFEDASGKSVASGDVILDEVALSRALSIERGLRDSGIDIVPRAVTPFRVSGEFRYTTTAGWDILTSIEPNPEATLSALRLVLAKEIPEERRAKLRYIDLRTEKKVFYSFIPEESVPMETVKDAGSDSKDKKTKDEKKK